MPDLQAQTLQLATALKETFPELTFAKDPNTGEVTITTAALIITVAPAAGEMLQETKLKDLGIVPLVGLGTLAGASLGAAGVAGKAVYDHTKSAYQHLTQARPTPAGTYQVKGQHQGVLREGLRELFGGSDEGVSPESVARIRALVGQSLQKNNYFASPVGELTDAQYRSLMDDTQKLMFVRSYVADPHTIEQQLAVLISRQKAEANFRAEAYRIKRAADPYKSEDDKYLKFLRHSQKMGRIAPALKWTKVGMKDEDKRGGTPKPSPLNEAEHGTPCPQCNGVGHFGEAGLGQEDCYACGGTGDVPLTEGEQPLGASSEPAYTSKDVVAVPVMAHRIQEAFDDHTQAAGNSRGEFSLEDLHAAVSNPAPVSAVLGKRMGDQEETVFSAENFIAGHTPRSIDPRNPGGKQAMDPAVVKEAYLVEVKNALLQRIPELKMFKQTYITRPQGSGVMFACWWADSAHTATHHELGIQAKIPVTMSVKVLLTPKNGQWQAYAETYLSEIYAGSFDENHPEGLLPDLQQTFPLSQLRGVVGQIAVRVKEYVRYAEQKNGPLRGE